MIKAGMKQHITEDTKYEPRIAQCSIVLAMYDVSSDFEPVIGGHVVSRPRNHLRIQSTIRVTHKRMV